MSVNILSFKRFLIIGLFSTLGVLPYLAQAHPLLASVFYNSVYAKKIAAQQNNQSSGNQASTQPEQNNFLTLLQTPIIAYILFILGCYFIVIELHYFGMVFPGMIGLVCIILGLYGLVSADYNTYLALFLLLLSITLMTAEIHIPSNGVFLLLGFIVFFGGSYWLFSASTLGVPWLIVGFFAVINLCFFGSIVYFMQKTYRQKSVSGTDIMMGSTAEVVEVQDKQLKVSIEGEIWKAEIEDYGVKTGDLVQVTKVKGLILLVKKYN